MAAALGFAPKFRRMALPALGEAGAGQNRFHGGPRRADPRTCRRMEIAVSLLAGISCDPSPSA